MARLLLPALLGLLLAPALAAQELRGIVTDEVGAPLATATVELWWGIGGSTSGRPPWAPDATTTTDAQGRWSAVRVDDGSPCSAIVIASAAGRSPRGLELSRDELAWRSPILLHPIGLRPLVPSMPRPARVTHCVRVVDADGAACPDLPLRVLRSRWAIMGADGRAEVAVVGSALRLELDVPTRPSGRSTTIELTCPLPAPSDELLVQLPRLDARLEGRTDLGRQQHPAGLMHESVVVEFEPDDDSYRLRCDVEGGSFSLAAPAGASGWLVARPLQRAGFCGNGFVPFRAPPVRVPAQANATNVSLRIPDGAVEGRVVGPIGLGVGDADVGIQLPSGEEVTLKTSWSGEFDLWCLPAGTLTARVADASGRGQATLEVVDGRSSALLVVLDE